MLTKVSLPYLTLSIVFLCSSCELMGPDTEPDLRALTSQEEKLVEADNVFGLKLFREINASQQDQNVFVSPLSVSMALGMTLNGARGQTRTDMEKALELSGLSVEEINHAYESLIDLLVGLDPEVVFEIANSIWYRQGYQVESAFIDVNRKHFDAEVREEDFSRAEAVEAINGWVDEKTHGKIEEIIDRIDPEVVMYLINAIYFKGTWQYEFDSKQTKKDSYYLSDGTNIQVDMMAQETELPYYETDQFQVVDLPYGSGQFTMTIFLPKPGYGLNSLVESVDVKAWNTWTNHLNEARVRVYLPKFKLQYKEELRKVLSALGMGIAFTDSADFSGISIRDQLLISKVLHKTFVEVDEKGTEAAAVTAVEVSLTSAGPQEPQVFVVRIDRPFVFAIREHHSGTILFIGKMMNPSL